MDIILLSKHHGTSRYLRLSKPKATLLALGVTVVLVAVASMGYVIGSQTSPLFERQLARSIESDILQQREQIEEAKRKAQTELKAMTRRIANMQARLVRLDALGERLVDVAKLRNEEFNFANAPPVGGPSEEDMGEAYHRPTFISALDQLTQDIDARERQLEVMESLLENRKLRKDVFIAGRPIESGWLSSRYGRRTDPFTGRLAWHKGLDFAGKDGSDIVTVASGVVTWAEDRYGYGLMVEVNHGGGFKTRYAHCKDILVEVGDVVQKGQMIAKMGSTGRSTGPHVHFEVWKNGQRVDPVRYVHRANR